MFTIYQWDAKFNFDAKQPKATRGVVKRPSTRQVIILCLGPFVIYQEHRREIWNKLSKVIIAFAITVDSPQK